MDPVLWHKLASDGASEIGPSPSATYGSLAFDASVKFGNRANFSGASKYMEWGTFDSSIVNGWDKFSMTFFIKPNWNLVGGFPPDTQRIIWRFDDGSSTKVSDFFTMISAWGGTGLTHRHLSGTDISIGTTDYDWSSGDTVFVCIVYDKDGIDGGSDTYKIYKDTVEVFSSTTVLPTVSATYKFWIGGSAYGYGADAGMANLKLYDDTISQTTIDWDYVNEGPEVVVTNSYFIIN